MCTDTPDTSGSQELARTQAALSKEQLEWAKEIYADTAPAREAASKRASDISDQQLRSMRLQDRISEDAVEYQKSNFRPLEQKIAADALAFDTPARREQEAAEAMASTGTAIDAQRRNAIDDLSSRGVDVSSGSTALALSRGSIGAGAMQAAAGNDARKKVETLGAAKLSDAANLGRNIASGQATAAGLALNAGNSATNNAMASLAPQQQATAAMHAAYGGSSQAAGSAAGIYDSVNRTNMAAAQTNAQQETGAASAAASLAMLAYLAPASDKHQKKGIKPVKGDMALAAVKKMPVKAWQYKDSSPAADGGQTHIGPMAQDVNAAAGEQAAPGGKVLDLITMNGMTLAAIQNVDKRLAKLEHKRPRAKKGANHG